MTSFLPALLVQSLTPPLLRSFGVFDVRRSATGLNRLIKKRLAGLR